MKNLLISFSGGRTSGFMLKYIFTDAKYNDVKKLVLFANTGKENEATLRFVHEIERKWHIPIVWIEADIQPEKGQGTKYKVVDYETASRNGQPFEELIQKYGLPSKYYRHCTRDLKEIPMHKYAKEYFGEPYHTAIGIRADEPHRIGNDPMKHYPLEALNIDEQFVRRWWDDQPFDLQLKDYQGNCDLCFLKSVRKKLTIIKEDNLWYWWALMEETYSNEKQSKFDAHRSLTIDDLVEMSKLPFREAKDLFELRSEQPALFDIDFDCFCKAN